MRAAKALAILISERGKSGLQGSTILATG